ncbi:iron(III) transport system substrate-binding protein [Spirochaetota bacterium]|nr:iron(III) transport system substrate-binding protein [Spirochaetota bacterium]
MKNAQTPQLPVKPLLVSSVTTLKVVARKLPKKLPVLLLGFIFSTIISLHNPLSAQRTQKSNENVVNIYSYRQEFLIRPLLDAFTKKTGIDTRVVFLKKGMLERLKSEGRNSPADVVLTVDVSRFRDLKEAGVLQKIRSGTVNRNIPTKYRDPEGMWIALTTRARIIYASEERVKDGEILTYEELADPKWRGRICTRSGYHVYNIALITSLIAHHGEQATEKWLTGLKNNLARKPQGNDRAQVKAIKEGLCDISIGNSYYYGKMLFNDKNPEQKAWAKSVKLIFPNQANRGTHMNISGAALTRYAPHKKNAIKFIDYLSSDEAQFIYGEVNFEFPVKSSVNKPSKIKELASNFKEDNLPLQEIMDNYKKAVILLDKVKFDEL